MRKGLKKSKEGRSIKGVEGIEGGRGKLRRGGKEQRGEGKDEKGRRE